MASPAKSAPRASGVVGTLSGLFGAHKNPAKHAVMELLTTLASEELAELPERVAAAEGALEMLSEGGPVNARNPYYMTLLSTFIRVANDRLLHANGQLSSEDAETGREMFELVRKTCADEWRALPREMSDKPDVVKIEELRTEATVKALLFYKHASKAWRNTITEAKKAAAETAAKAGVSNMLARLAALKAQGHGGSRRRRGGKTRRGKKTRRGGGTRRSSWF